MSSESQTRSFAQGHFTPQNFLSSEDVFGCRAFIENRGQYPSVNGKEVLYVLDNAQEKIYFTKTGLIYEIKQITSQSKEDFEEIEHGKTPRPLKVNYIDMTWKGSNANIVVEPSEKQSY